MCLNIGDNLPVLFVNQIERTTKIVVSTTFFCSMASKSNETHEDPLTQKLLDSIKSESEIRLEEGVYTLSNPVLCSKALKIIGSNKDRVIIQGTAGIFWIFRLKDL